MRSSRARELHADGYELDDWVLARTTIREPREQTQPAPNRAARRAQGRYRSHKRSAIRRAVFAAMQAGHVTPRDFLEKRGLAE